MIGTRPLGENGHFAVPGYSDPYRPQTSRWAGRDDTLNPDEAGVGTERGYMGRDVFADSTYNADPGMFARLHQEAGQASG